MKISFKNSIQPFLNGVSIKGEINLKKDYINLILGENGIGKSSILYFLIKNQNKFFSNIDISVVSQKRLETINHLSGNGLLDLYRKLKRPKSLSLYEEIKDACDSFLHMPINELSGGQNQMLKILFSAYKGGDLFIFDEPFQYLDQNFQKLLRNYLESLIKDKKYILLVEHQKTMVNPFDLNIISMREEGDKIWIG